ncbi:PR domain zinc finger protein 8-like [Lethenteron reissneri]|uniref:PR domain zinc finger protein 8-like n=1 Tax=Lethenteron reissneri TaxID=7753 RepID=UPI002AB688F2|nr:PR domain zinc finger protein 8-like [Lethenteron reissneri]
MDVEAAGMVVKGPWDDDVRAVQQRLADIFTSVFTTCDVPEHAILGPCLLSSASFIDTIAFIALKAVDKRTAPYVFRVDTTASQGAADGVAWLRLVQPARDRAEQNLEAYLKNGQLFYRSLRKISRDEELLVWYGRELAALLRLDDTVPHKAANGGVSPSSPLLRCGECQQAFHFEFPYAAHLRFLCQKRRDFSILHENLRILAFPGGGPAHHHHHGVGGGGGAVLSPAALLHQHLLEGKRAAAAAAAAAAGLFLESGKRVTNFHSLAHDMEKARRPSSDADERTPAKRARASAKPLPASGDSPPAAAAKGDCALVSKAASVPVAGALDEHRDATTTTNIGGCDGATRDERVVKDDRERSSDDVDEVREAPRRPCYATDALQQQQQHGSKRSAFTEVVRKAGKERAEDEACEAFAAALRSRSASAELCGGAKTLSETRAEVAINAAAAFTSLLKSPLGGAERKSAFSQPVRPFAQLSASMLPPSMQGSKQHGLEINGGGGLQNAYKHHQQQQQHHTPHHHHHHHQQHHQQQQTPFLLAPAFWPKATAIPVQLPGALPLLPPTLTPLGLPAQNWCAKCNTSFRMTSDLVYHMRSHHKKEYAEEPVLKRRREDKLKCPICNETFRERHHLSRHMTSHN